MRAFVRLTVACLLGIAAMILVLEVAVTHSLLYVVAAVVAGYLALHFASEDSRPTYRRFISEEQPYVDHKCDFGPK